MTDLRIAVTLRSMVLRLLKPGKVHSKTSNQDLRNYLRRVLPAKVPDDPIKLFSTTVADFYQNPKARLFVVFFSRARRGWKIKEVGLWVGEVFVKTVDGELEKQTGGDTFHVDLELAVDAVAVVLFRKHATQTTLKGPQVIKKKLIVND